MKDKLWFVTFRRIGRSFNSEDHYRVWSSSRNGAIEQAKESLVADFGAADAQRATLIDVEKLI